MFNLLDIAFLALQRLVPKKSPYRPQPSPEYLKAVHKVSGIVHKSLAEHANTNVGKSIISKSLAEHVNTNVGKSIVSKSLAEHVKSERIADAIKMLSHAEKIAILDYVLDGIETIHSTATDHIPLSYEFYSIIHTPSLSYEHITRHSEYDKITHLPALSYDFLPAPKKEQYAIHYGRTLTYDYLPAPKKEPYAIYYDRTLTYEYLPAPKKEPYAIYYDRTLTYEYIPSPKKEPYAIYYDRTLTYEYIPSPKKYPTIHHFRPDEDYAQYSHPLTIQHIEPHEDYAQYSHPLTIQHIEPHEDYAQYSHPLTIHHIPHTAFDSVNAPTKHQDIHYIYHINYDYVNSPTKHQTLHHIPQVNYDYVNSPTKHQTLHHTYYIDYDYVDSPTKHQTLHHTYYIDYDYVDSPTKHQTLHHIPQIRYHYIDSPTKHQTLHHISYIDYGYLNVYKSGTLKYVTSLNSNATGHDLLVSRIDHNNSKFLDTATKLTTTTRLYHDNSSFSSGLNNISNLSIATKYAPQREGTPVTIKFNGIKYTSLQETNIKKTQSLTPKFNPVVNTGITQSRLPSIVTISQLTSDTTFDPPALTIEGDAFDLESKIFKYFKREKITSGEWHYLFDGTHYNWSESQIKTHSDNPNIHKYCYFEHTIYLVMDMTSFNILAEVDGRIVYDVNAAERAEAAIKKDMQLITYLSKDEIEVFPILSSFNCVKIVNTYRQATHRDEGKRWFERQFYDSGSPLRTLTDIISTANIAADIYEPCALEDNIGDLYEKFDPDNPPPLDPNVIPCITPTDVVTPEYSGVDLTLVCTSAPVVIWVNSPLLKEPFIQAYYVGINPDDPNESFRWDIDSLNEYVFQYSGEQIIVNVVLETISGNMQGFDFIITYIESFGFGYTTTFKIEFPPALFLGDRYNICGTKYTLCGNRYELCGAKYTLCGVKYILCI
jgi:hypothetical protein